MNKQIKIIKRNELGLLRNLDAASTKDLKTDSQFGREIASTIAAWIDERQELNKQRSRVARKLHRDLNHPNAPDLERTRAACSKDAAKLLQFARKDFDIYPI